MTTYAQIKFKMKNGYKAPTMYEPQCGDFRDVAVKILKNYYAKHNLEWQYEASHMTISGEELQEFAELYANEVDTQEINVYIYRDGDDDRATLFPSQFLNADKTDISEYHVDQASNAFIPIYHQFSDWAFTENFEEAQKNIDIFRKYIELTLNNQMFFGVQISKIESVTLQLS